MSKSTAPRSMLNRAIIPSALSAMSSSNSGACALSGTARKNAPSISGGISPSTSRSRTEISARRGKLLPMKWMVCGKAFIGPYSLPIPRGLTLTTVIIEGKGALLCARSKGRTGAQANRERCGAQPQGGDAAPAAQADQPANGAVLDPPRPSLQDQPQRVPPADDDRRARADRQPRTRRADRGKRDERQPRGGDAAAPRSDRGRARSGQPP